jgi:hypothetical protein
MSSRLTLVVPGLVWPAPLTPRPAQDLQLPALSWLLGRGRRRIGPSAHLETELAHLFGLPADAPPLAALRRQGEAHAAATSASHWLCADPVHLSITSGNLLLGDFAADEIDAAEAAALVATLNEHYSDLGEFSAPSPTRWYLRLAAAPNVAFFNLDDTAGRPMQHFLPTGADARRWQRVLNEIQVALHDHPVNKAREAAGKRAVNSVWFWGNAPAFVGANNYSPNTIRQTRIIRPSCRTKNDTNELRGSPPIHPPPRRARFSTASRNGASSGSVAAKFSRLARAFALIARASTSGAAASSFGNSTLILMRSSA